ncbi:glycosyl transferase family 1, partial [Actinoplanes sp. NPDC051633]
MTQTLSSGDLRQSDGVPPKPSRGRVVMLVDNGVEGDSRVQKEARSAAAAGWEVTLVGLVTRGSERDSWRIGDAEVQLKGVRAHLRDHKSTFRRSLRHPLAYPPGNKTAVYRMQEVRAHRAELVTRFGALAAARRAGDPAWSLKLRRAALVPSQVKLRVERLWASYRRSEMRKLQAARGNGDALFTRVPIRFWQATRGERAWRQLDPALWDFEISLGG